jgi:aminomethyltransferase
VRHSRESGNPVLDSPVEPENDKGTFMSHQLPLNELWRSLGARFQRENDYEIPLDFKGVEHEYKAAQERAGLIDLSYRGKIRVTGADRVEFLHSILTNDIKSLKAGDGCRAMLLNATGKVLADFFVCVFSDFILLDTEISFASKWIKLLDAFVISEDVQLHDITEQWTHLSLRGPEAKKILGKFITDPIVLSKPFSHSTVHIQDVEVILILIPSKLPHYQILIPTAMLLKVIKTFLDARILSEMEPVGYDTAEILRIEAGELRYGKDITAEITLPETGLDETAASETKGCYPGQEVVARTRTYKGLQKKICKLIFDGALLPVQGSEIYAKKNSETKIVGWISSCGFLPPNRILALGYFRKGFFETSLKISLNPDLNSSGISQPLES